MPHICPATGHVVTHPRGVFCPDHGAPLFTNCPVCGKAWLPRGSVPTLSGEDPARDFCDYCAHPGPWVSREQRLMWIKGRLHDQGLDEATQLELREAFDRMREMDPGDTRTLAAWQKLKNAAPRLWDIAKPIITT